MKLKAPVDQYTLFSPKIDRPALLVTSKGHTIITLFFATPTAENTENETYWVPPRTPLNFN